MKICGYCGKEYPDEATVCTLDQTPLESRSKSVSWSGRTYCVELYSPLPPAECVARLKTAIDNESFFIVSSAALRGSKRVIGRVTDSSIRLHKRIYYRNSFQSYFFASLTPEGGGTVISGKFKMHPAVWIFLAIWLCGVLFIGGMLLSVGALHPWIRLYFWEQPYLLLGSFCSDGFWRGMNQFTS